MIAEERKFLFIRRMKTGFRVILSSISLLVGTVCIASPLLEPLGPFPVRRTPVDPMSFTYTRKLEAVTAAIDLATWVPSPAQLVDGVLTLQNSAKVQAPVVDPATGLVQVDAAGKTVYETKTLAAGTVLDPTRNPADNVILPKDLTVTALVSVSGNLTFGRFAYLGVAPRFEAKNLEMFASKMGHSLRVKGYVTQALLDGYEFQLLSKFKSYYDMFARTTVHLEPLRDLKQMAATERNPDRKKWTTVASFYSKTLYENPTINVFDSSLSEPAYKNAILTVMIRTYLNDPNATIASGLALYQSYRNDPNFAATRKSASAALFKANLGEHYAEGQPVPAVASVMDIAPITVEAADADPIVAVPHPDAVGVVNFVYPIAIDKDGPFGLPRPGLRRFPLSSSIEGRWFSLRWLDEFGGFPFLMITPEGVAFHGPITFNSGNDTWYLRRDNVSHSCMRMDGSDIMELRALLPKNMNSLQRLGTTIPLRITEWPDVDDLNNDGKNEVVDVAYYTMPTPGTRIVNPNVWKPEVNNKEYWKRMFGPSVGKLPSQNTFTISTTPDGKNSGVFTGIPKYDIVGGALTVVGYYMEELPIKTMPQRPTQIIQYREDGVLYNDPESGGGDYNGTYPPGVVNKF